MVILAQIVCVLVGVSIVSLFYPASLLFVGHRMSLLLEYHRVSVQSVDAAESVTMQRIHVA